MQHALVVGGTGMLSGLSLALAERGFRVSVIARSPASLQKLTEEAIGAKGMIHPLTLDYTDSDLLIHSLERSIKYCGPIELAVIWIHNTAPEAPLRIAELLEQNNTKCDYYHVLGSGAFDLAKQEQTNEFSAKKFNFVQYRKILLGFVVESGNSRWLTHEEISGGVLRAIDSKQDLFVVGQVEPWSKRP